MSSDEELKKALESGDENKIPYSPLEIMDEYFICPGLYDDDPKYPNLGEDNDCDSDEIWSKNQINDDYSTPGKSIAELHGLDEHDPWGKIPEVDEEELIKKLDDMLSKILEENGNKIPEKTIEEPKFVDPDNDEDLTIESISASVFWKIEFPNKRLIDLIAIEPSLKKLVLVGRNNAAGCWVVFTSKKISERISRTFNEANIQNELYRCNTDGIKNSKTKIKNIEDQRPWNPNGKDASSYNPKEFYYCIKIIENKVFVYFVPEIWWIENQKIYNETLNIENLVKEILTEVNYCYCFVSTSGELTTQAWLDGKGFRENLMFNSYINEMGL